METLRIYPCSGIPSKLLCNLLKRPAFSWRLVIQAFFPWILTTPWPLSWSANHNHDIRAKSCHPSISTSSKRTPCCELSRQEASSAQLPHHTLGRGSLSHQHNIRKPCTAKCLASALPLRCLGSRKIHDSSLDIRGSKRCRAGPE